MLCLSPSEEKSRFALRVAGAKLNKVFIGPEVVHLHINNECNLRCGYCSNHSPECPHHNVENWDMTLSKFSEILDDCLSLKVDSLLISGDGEPTIHPQFTQMMLLLKGKTIKTTLMTNATYPANLRQTIVEVMDRIIINLSAPDAKTFKELTSEDLFNEVIDNIKFLVKWREKHKTSLEIIISVVKNSINIDRLDDLKKLGQDLGVYVILRPLSHNSHNTKVRLKSDPSSKTGNGREIPCLNGWFYFSAISNGDVSPCCHISSINIADLNKSSLKDIWNSKEFHAVRLASKAMEFQQKHQACRECQLTPQNLRIAQLAKIPIPENYRVALK